MLVIVGKAIPNKERSHVELFLDEFRNLLRSRGKFVYAWSFNPDEQAVAAMQKYLGTDEVFIYLPDKDCLSKLRMHIIDFRRGPQCPVEWQSYCVKELLDQRKFGANRRIWFLIDSIEDLKPPIDLLNTFTPVFSHKYNKWGQKHFAFLRDK
jgi:hypothetical protein